MPLAPGDVFAGYTIVRTLGAGGMGEVHLARHPRLPRADALKVLRPEHSADPHFAARFRREADLVARLSHRNVVPVLDRGEAEGRLWLTMRYVEGTDAEGALAAAGGLLPAERAVRIVGEVAAALDAAHRAGLLHRDVKPANVLLAPGEDGEPEQVFLTDFGIAKALDGGTTLTRTGMVLATFEYASPEQIESRPLDARSDVYSLGCLLHRLLTGQVPFPGTSVLASLHGHLTAPPPRPTGLAPWLPPGLDDVVARAMAKDLAARFPTCRALAAAASAALADLPPAPAPPYRLTLPSGQTVSTADLPTAGTERLAGLLRRTRFFDLPPVLPGDLPEPPTTSAVPRGPARPVTVEIATATTTRRVTVDLADARRPPEFEALAAAVAATRPRVRPVPPPLPPPPRPPAPTTVTAPAVRPAADLPPTGSRRAARWAVAGVAVLVLAGAGGTVWLLGRDDPAAGGDGASAGTTAPAEESGPAAALAGLPRSPAPLPDGAVLVSREVDGEVDLLAVDAGTGAAVPLVTAPGADIGAVVSPDRRTVVYGHVTDAGGELRAVAADGRGDRPLFAAPLDGCADPGRPAWDRADPTRLALTCAGGDGVSLHLVGLDGAVGPALATAPALGDPAFSPDGTTVVYWAGQDPERDGGSLFAVAADGGDPGRLTDEEDGSDADPSFAPDGRTLAFRREVVGGERGIVTMAADGSGPRFVTSGSFDQDPVWSPDGTALAYKSNRYGDAAPAGDQLWVVDPDGLDRRQVPADDGVLVNAVAWGPPAG